MRKRVFGRKLSRGRGARNALFRSLMRSVISQHSITTTRAKAKAVQGEIDKIITTAKQDTVFARRQVLAKLGNDKVVALKLFSEILPSVAGRNSGYTRIVQLPRRRGDSAEVSILEFVDKIEKKQEEKKTKTKEAKKAKSQPSDKPQAKSKEK